MPGPTDRLRPLARRLRQALVRRLRPAPSSYLDVERAELALYLTFLREGMTVFDVGANVGELALVFSKFVGDGHVHAFEASSEAFGRLTGVCDAAGRRNVTLNHVAVGDREGTAHLHVYPDHYLSWSTMAVRPLDRYGIDVQSTATEAVPMTTVDAYCEANGVARIDLLKVDVEGAELQVLVGARRMLSERRVGCVTFEFGQTTFDMGNTPGEIEDFLGGLGYHVRNVVPGDPVFPGRAGAASAVYSMHVATPGAQ